MNQHNPTITGEYPSIGNMLPEIRRVALCAARRGGEVISRLYGRFRRLEKKGAIDLVTEADTESEALVIQTILDAFPDHGILGEESGERAGTAPFRWIIDPLDGTTNFAHGLPQVSVSIAVLHETMPVYAVVFAPLLRELYSAGAGTGAFLNGRPVTASTARQIEDSLLVTGFPYDFKNRPLIMERFRRCLWAARGVRRYGSAALDLAWVAAGRFDGYFEEGLKPWDTAAGWLIATEAGAVVTDYEGATWSPESGSILACAPGIHEPIRELLSETDNHK